ncbi:hypothetical protein FH972_005467 [Carpinus fangiana]|uniref:Alpha/beta hydrolase fold-3 domain-containing protein n=1 Tax=Carpinus fangiana TaxID=176857 RepID=A0A5N6QSM0_9ROSI|nr:hypothetical protein FH972_005467 [Carpinus fangiana]
MDSLNNHVLHDFRFFRVYNDGRIETFRSTHKIPPSNDQITGSTFSPEFHKLANSSATKSNAIVISIEYGLFPKRHLLACYEDSWAGLQLVASHANRDGSRAMVPGVKLVGLILVHPFLGGTEDDHMWLYMCPTNGGLEDPRLKPSIEDLSKLRWRDQDGMSRFLAANINVEMAKSHINAKSAKSPSEEIESFRQGNNEMDLRGAKGGCTTAFSFNEGALDKEGGRETV